MVAALTDLGPDTVELIVRDEVPDTLDAWGRPARVDRTITRARCAVMVSDSTELVAGATMNILKFSALVPVDAETEALTEFDAARFGGRTYELSVPGVRHDTLGGDPSHVRVVGVWAGDAGLGEQVVIVAAGRRLDTGLFEPDGLPTPVIARAVLPGNATRRFGGTGELIAADYTVVLPLDTAIADGDWIIVRGRDCRATVIAQENQWTAARELVVLAQYRGGA